MPRQGNIWSLGCATLGAATLAWSLGISTGLAHSSSFGKAYWPVLLATGALTLLSAPVGAWPRPAEPEGRTARLLLVIAGSAMALVGIGLPVLITYLQVMRMD